MRSIEMMDFKFKKSIMSFIRKGEDMMDKKDITVIKSINIRGAATLEYPSLHIWLLQSLHRLGRTADKLYDAEKSLHRNDRRKSRVGICRSIRRRGDLGYQGGQTPGIPKDDQRLSCR